MSVKCVRTRVVSRQRQSLDQIDATNQIWKAISSQVVPGAQEIMLFVFSFILECSSKIPRCRINGTMTLGEKTMVFPGILHGP